MRNIIGSQRQVKYARDIIKQIQQKYPNQELPDISSATYWINYQSEHPNRLWELSREIQTIFTDVFPRQNKNSAIDALEQIIKNLDMVVIVDCESTGLTKKDSIVEIGVVEFIRRKPVIAYETLIRPEHIDLTKYDRSKASQLNSITSEMLRNAPTLDKVWKFIEPYLNKHVLCFNNSFDVNMIIRSAKRYEHLHIPIINSTDIMRIATCYFEMPDYMSLDELVTKLHMRTPKENRHRAASDALLTGRALMKLYNLSRLEQ